MSLYKSNKNIKRATTFALTTSILIGNMYPIFADNNTQKEEVVYVKLNNNGNVNNVYVVNSFDSNNDGKIIDYGNYSNVVNLSTKDKLNYSNGVLDTNISEVDRKFYYQGEMETNEIPWDINIKYILDKKEISAKDLAGKSGDLQIELQVNQNSNVDKTFFDNYALQISLTLDGEKCENITTSGGTVASVGSKKTITYMKLAGQEAKYTINSKVKDFEMDAISFNGVNMEIDVDIDVDDMTGSLDDLVDAVEALNNGTGDLKTGIDDYKSGVNNLYKGTSSLESGVNSYKSGVGTLDNGISSLQSGISEYKSGVNTLYSGSRQLLEGAKSLNNGVNALYDGVNTLNSGASDLNNGLNTLSQGSKSYKQNLNAYANAVNQTVNALKANLTEEQIQALQLDNLVAGVNNLASAYENIDAGINKSASGASLLNNGSNELKNKMSVLSEGSSSLYSGIEELSSKSVGLVNGIDELGSGASSLKSGSKKLVNGIDELKNGTSSLKDGSSKLVNGIGKIDNGVTNLKNGTTKLNEKTSTMPKEIDSKIDDMVSKYSNSNFKPSSFASEENNNVKSLQFAIRTEAIEISKKDQKVIEEKKDESVWQLFLNLFKKDK